VLVLSEPEHGADVRAAIEGAAGEANATVSVVDVTCGLGALALLGPDAGELLARFCAIDVRPSVTPVTGFRPGSVGRTPGYVLKEADDRLLVLFGWAFGEYMWQVVADAAGHLGGGPVGADVLAHAGRATEAETPARA
jgi:heterotetrameric sarcosine oxidase gamma subunit